MSKFENHKKSFLNFKKDAENEVISKPSRAELYFLSIFHLIECCAAKYRVHINKHQKVRIVLENNPNIFENETENVWRLFQDIENKIRPYIIGPMEIMDTMDIMFRILNYMDTIHFIK